MTAAAETNGVTPPVATKKEGNGDLAKENLWSEILGEVQKQGSTKLPSNKSVLVLGDNASGKTTLIAKLQGVEDPKKGFGLEYAYIDVRDEYRDDVTRLGVWVLDGDPGHTNLLRFALSETNYSHTLVILTVSMNTPWLWMDQCQHWMKILADHVEKLAVPSAERQAAREKLVNIWQTYCETLDDLDSTSPMKRSTVGGGATSGPPELNRLSSVDDLEAEHLPLPEGTLASNLGLDIVVVVTKTDYMTTLEKEFDYRDEQFDFMQQWIRRFCLTHGASLFYTSVKEDKNCDLLYKYLTHRIYGLPFRTPALVVEKDAVLIPAGWDNMKKVSILYENMHSCKPEDYYPDIIVAPPSRKTQTNREADVQTEEEQAFLARQQQMLMAGGGQAPAARGESPMRGQPGTPKASLPRTPGQVQGTPKIDAKLTPGQPGGEGILANFFNSLLHKKAGTPGSPNVSLDGSTSGQFNSMPPNSTGRSSSVTRSNSNAGGAETPIEKMRSDAAAELDRLSRSTVKKEIDFSQQEAAQSDC